MICYKGKTFCVANCATYDCHRLLTPQVTEDAKQWWYPASGAVPISLHDYSSECPAYKKDYSKDTQ